MEDLYLIFASQDFSKANHNPLWFRLSEKTSFDVIVIDVPADIFVTFLKNKKFRFNDSKMGLRKIKQNLFLFRPFLIVRPEFLKGHFNKWIAKQLWYQLSKVYPNFASHRIIAIIYDAYWVKILKENNHELISAYYLFDEVRYNASSGALDMAKYKADMYACVNSDVVFTMTQLLYDSRKGFNSKIYLIGNGADLPIGPPSSGKIPQSVAFIGNFRNWIDCILLENLIHLRRDVNFYFAGPVEVELKCFLSKLVNENVNVFYCGCVKKRDVCLLYQVFNIVIVPYKQNAFTIATRPIKIVEAVLAGTPVITIPIDGYPESSFIRYARNVHEFSDEIDFLLSNPINKSSTEYNLFVKDNTWSSKAEKMIKIIEKDTTNQNENK